MANGFLDRSYMQLIEASILPLSVQDVIVDFESVHIKCRHQDASPLNCPRCNLTVRKYDNGRERIVRHIDYRNHRVFIHLSIPRTICSKHGVLQISQSLVPAKGKLTLPMQAWLASQIKDDESEAEFARRLGLTRGIIDRGISSTAQRLTRIESDWIQRVNILTTSFLNAKAIVIVSDASFLLPLT